MLKIVGFFSLGLLCFQSDRLLTFLDSTANSSLLCCAAADISVHCLGFPYAAFQALLSKSLPYKCMIWQTDNCLGRDCV